MQRVQRRSSTKPVWYYAVKPHATSELCTTDINELVAQVTQAIMSEMGDAGPAAQEKIAAELGRARHEAQEQITTPEPKQLKRR